MAVGKGSAKGSYEWGPGLRLPNWFGAEVLLGVVRNVDCVERLRKSGSREGQAQERAVSKPGLVADPNGSPSGLDRCF